MKRKISPFKYDVLKTELGYLEEVGELEKNKSEQLLEQYEIQQIYEDKNSLTSKKERNEVIGKNSSSFIGILFLIGTILIGFSVLSFVASNWSAMTNFEKFFLLLAGLVISYCTAWSLEDKKPLLSKSLYYIGVFIYGAEIFFIGQMFHLEGSLGTAFLAWSVGIVLLALYLKDKNLYGIGLLFFYFFIQADLVWINELQPSYWLIPIVLTLMYMNKYSRYFKWSNQAILLAFLYQFVAMKFLFRFDNISPTNYGIEFVYVAIALVLLILFSKRLFPSENSNTSKMTSLFLLIVNLQFIYFFIQSRIMWVVYEGSIIYTIPAVATVIALFVYGHKVLNKHWSLFILNTLVAIELCFLLLAKIDCEEPYIYAIIVFILGIVFTHVKSIGYGNAMKYMGLILQFVSGFLLTFSYMYLEESNFAILFGLLYGLYGFYLVYQRNLFGVFLVSVLIFRFYVDMSFAFMSKSIAFFVGGVLLLGLGYWFEKVRKGEHKNEE